MAGSYADALGFKFQYDADGSAGFLWDSASVSAPTPLTATQMQNLNGEAGGNPPTANDNGQTTYLGVVFPELRDLTGVCFLGEPFTEANTNFFQTSPDTTNGQDGTWTTQVTAAAWALAINFNNAVLRPYYRTVIKSLSLTGIKGIRFLGRFNGGTTRGVQAIHVYGNYSSGQTPNRLRLWHPTLDQELGYAGLDFGDTARAGTYTKQFRVKNNSSTLQANSIVVSTEALSDATPTVVGVLAIDNNGSGYASSQNIGNLAAGAISAVQTLRCQPSSTAQVGTWRQRVKAAAGSWT